MPNKPIGLSVGIASINYTGYSFTGHSRGDGLAQYMTHVANVMEHAFTFHAAGIGQAITGVDPMTYEADI